MIPSTHRVQPGESWRSIAELYHHGSRWRELCSCNCVAVLPALPARTIAGCSLSSLPPRGSRAPRVGEVLELPEEWGSP